MLLMAPVYVLLMVVPPEPFVVARRFVLSVGMTTNFGVVGASPIHCAIRSVVRVKKLVMYEYVRRAMLSPGVAEGRVYMTADDCS